MLCSAESGLGGWCELMSKHELSMRSLYARQARAVLSVA
jgi:hypothetical protein